MNEFASESGEVLLAEQGLEKEKGFPKWEAYQKAGGVLPKVTFERIVDFWQDTQREAENMAAETNIEPTPSVIDYYRILRGDMGGFLTQMAEQRLWSNKKIWIKALTLAGEIPRGGFGVEAYDACRRELDKSYPKYIGQGGVIAQLVKASREGAVQQINGMVNQVNRFWQQKGIEKEDFKVTPLVIDCYRILQENAANILGIPKGASVLGADDNPRKWSDQRILTESLLIAGEFEEHQKLKTYFEEAFKKQEETR